MHWYQFYECIDTGDLYSCISPLFTMPLKSLSRNKNGHSRDCSLADRMDRVYEKDYLKVMPVLLYPGVRQLLPVQ
jgi:hypothetical protein